MKRQILKTILLALPKVLTYKARRFPAFRERLKQRNLAVRIELQDGSIGRTLEFRDGRIRSRSARPHAARCAHVVQGCGDRPEIPHAEPGPGRDHPRGQEFQGGDRGAGRARGLVRADHEHDPDRRPADGHAHARRQPPLHQLHQRRPRLRPCQGRQDPARDAAGDGPQRPTGLGDRGPRTALPPAAPRPGGAPRPDAQVAGLFRQAHPPSPEARRLRSRRRAQPAEPRQVGICAHQLG